MNADFISSLEKLLRGLVQSFVDCEDQVEVNSVESDHDVTFILQVNSIDLEKHFAVGANTLRALKVVLVSIGAKKGLHVILEIRESNARSDVWGDDSLASENRPSTA